MSVLRDVIKRDHRAYLMMCTELIKLNASVCYNDNRVQDLIRGMSTKLGEVPELAEYLEDFKRRCLASHRAAARKRVVSFYFTRCQDLCDDAIERVLEFM
jgi:cytochrome oxidase Cu insertion factor (SCO1/SenC/PrrC family)